MKTISNMENILLSNLKAPTQCHLWKKAELVPEDLYYFVLEEIHTFYEDSHYSRRLKRCNQCGQLYLVEFYEEVDWVGGEDPQYVTCVPVENMQQAEMINQADRYEFMGYSPSIRSDWPKDGPHVVYWIGRKEPMSQCDLPNK